MSEAVAFAAAAAHSPAVHAALGRAAGALIVPLGRQLGRRLRGDAETRALRQAAADALTRSIEHARQPDIAADEAWWELIADSLADAFGDQRLARELVRFVPGEGTDPATVAALRRALADRHDLALLQDTLDVEEFVFVLPGTLADEVFRGAAAEAGPLRGLWQLRQLEEIRAALTADRVVPLSTRQLRMELLWLLTRLDEAATGDELPAYLPADLDFDRYTQAANTRVGLRAAGSATPADPYAVLGAGTGDSRKVLDWAAATERFPRLVVLADPGYGKSWLLRAETHRLASAGLRQLRPAPTPVTENGGNEPELPQPPPGIDLVTGRLPDPPRVLGLTEAAVPPERVSATSPDEIAVPVLVRADELADAVVGEGQFGAGLAGLIANRHRLAPTQRAAGGRRHRGATRPAHPRPRRPWVSGGGTGRPAGGRRHRGATRPAHRRRPPRPVDGSVGARRDSRQRRSWTSEPRSRLRWRHDPRCP